MRRPTQSCAAVSVCCSLPCAAVSTRCSLPCAAAVLQKARDIAVAGLAALTKRWTHSHQRSRRRPRSTTTRYILSYCTCTLTTILSYSYLIRQACVSAQEEASSLLPIPPPRSILSVLRLQATRSDACRFNRDRLLSLHHLLIFHNCPPLGATSYVERERETTTAGEASCLFLNNLLCKTLQHNRSPGPMARV